MTKPRSRSFITVFFTLKLNISSSTASKRDWWCVLLGLNSIVSSEGPKVTTILDFKAPALAHPIGTLPIPSISCTSYRRGCSGLSESLSGLLIGFRTSKGVKPLHQPRLGGLSTILTLSKLYFGAHWRHGVCLILAVNHLLPTKSENKPVYAMVHQWRH